MAIQDNTTTNSSTVNTNTASVHDANVNATTPAARTMSFMKMGAVGGLSRTPSSEVLTKAMFALDIEIKKLTEKPWEVTLLAVDNSKVTNLAFSGIVVAVRRTDAPARGLCYHTILLEESGEPIASRIETFRGQQFEIQRLVGDAYEQQYGSTVFEIVKRAFPNIKDIRSVDAQVVPRGFNFEDKDAIHALALNTQLPCYTALEVMDPTFQDMNLTQVEKDSTLSVRIAFNEPQKSDYAGLPVRNDISIVLSASSVQQAGQNNQINAQDRSKTIATIGGYIDPVWAPANNGQFNFNPNIPQPKFAARFVITNLENVAQTTIASQLLALTSSFVLREGNNWFPYFSPRPMGAGGRTVDLRDIGAINIEGNMSNNVDGFDKYIDTKSANFTPQDLGRLIQMNFRPGMHYSLRVSECGADTWYNSVFKAAADNHKGAIRAILMAANTLTGGHFGQIYGNEESPVHIDYSRVHLGHYLDSNGQKRDISDIDYLAIMNLVGKGAPTSGAEWVNTMFREDQPIALRLAARKKMIESVTHGEVTYTGFARLVTFTGRFIDALAKGCALAGLDMRTINPSVTGDYFTQRAQANYLDQVQVMPGISGLFTQGYGTVATANNAGYNGRVW